MNSESILEFTGERFTPECVREIRYEHLHRYAFAQAMAAGKRVLDAACGEGYGSSVLAAVASEVVGVDIDRASVEHARRRYGSALNLRFEQGDVTRLDDLPAASFDLIVSFETLEHLTAQERLLDGFARLLAPQGLLLISTPDKRNYSDIAGHRNEFHLRELYRPEFEALLSPRFVARRLLGQKLLFQSILFDTGPGRRWEAATAHGERIAAGLDYAPMYWLAACSHDPSALDGLPGLHLFGDAEESVYTHYYGEIRRNMAAGGRIAELEAQVRDLEVRLSQAESKQER